MASKPEGWYGSPDVVDRVLNDSRLWFVVGLGNNPGRDAYGIARLLQSRGKRVIPIHPRAEIVHGEQGYATISAAAEVHGAPDVVDMFVRSDRVGAFVDEAIAVGARSVWLQLGVVDELAAERAADAGLDVVMDNCPAIAWGRGSLD